MSQGSLTINDGDGGTVLAKINDALQRLATRGSGTSRPSDIAAFEEWTDTDTPGGGVASRFLYDGSDDILLYYIDVTNNAIIAANDVQATSIASATTTDIGAARGRYVKVTGTTTITGLGTVQAGTNRLVEFTGALTLTHHATSLILPGAADIATQAGDVAFFVSEGSGNWRCVNYQRAAFIPAALQKVQMVQTVTGAVAASSTVGPFDDTIPQSGEGVQFMSRAITPKSATSLLQIDVVFFGAGSTQAVLVAALFKDSETDARAVGPVTVPGDNHLVAIGFTYFMTSGSTSAMTFKVRAYPTVGTMTFNGVAGVPLFGGTIASSITITELAP